MNDFQKLSDCIAYYQTYHLTKHKYQWRANALKYFDCFPLDQLRRFHVKQYFALRSVEVSNATINREVSFARAAINRVNSDFELKLSNPFNDVKFVEQDYILPILNKRIIKNYSSLLRSLIIMICMITLSY